MFTILVAVKLLRHWGSIFLQMFFESYSAGTETTPQINQDAVRLMKEMYQINMEETQYSKLLSEIPEVDIVITMGCNVKCPAIPCKYREDWGLNDPTGKNDAEFFKNNPFNPHKNPRIDRENRKGRVDYRE